MTSLYNIFLKLKSESPNIGEGFAVASIPNIKNHKIGISQDNLPVFFIKCENNTKTTDTKLEFISVQFNRFCQLINQKGKKEESIYTIISLNSNADYLKKYFLKIVGILLDNITEKPLLNDLKIEIDKLINLFSKLTKPPIKTIQGLWAELLVIEHSKNPDYLIKSWHIASTDKYDFNDGVDKIEVKSTSKNRRIHNFSFEQLIPNFSSRLFIVSIFTIETGKGTSIFDIIEKIEKKVSDKNLIFQLNELVATTLGQDFEKSNNFFFDYQFSIDSINYYNSIDIPTIGAESIPSNIMNVRFDCDITDVKTLKNSNLNSKLLKSLF